MTDMPTSINTTGETERNKYHWYFAYGSNNSYEQLLRRLGNISPTYWDDDCDDGNKKKKSEGKAEALPNFAGVHNQSTETRVFPPLAIKVVLIPSLYFVIDAPSATRGLAYANLRKKNDSSSSASQLQCSHSHDSTKFPSELKARVPYTVSVAYLLSDAQLRMMDKFENAPDKYHREAVRGYVLKNIDPMPAWEREEKKEEETQNAASSPSSSPSSPSPAASAGGVIIVPRNTGARAAFMAKVSALADSVQKEIEVKLLALFPSSSRSVESNSKEKDNTQEPSLEDCRRVYEEAMEKLIASLTADAATTATVGDAVEKSSTATAGTTCSSLHLPVGTPIDGVAYIYEGTGLLHTDVVEGGEKDKNKATTTTTTSAAAGWAANINLPTSAPLQPSSSYMSRILEGEDFFALIDTPTNAADDDDDENKGDAEESAVDKPSLTTAAAKKVSVANKLLACYVRYLHAVEVSEIPSPRTLLRAAGKV